MWTAPLLLSLVHAYADELADAGRAVADRFGDAVVTLRVSDQERGPGEVSGTVLSSEGYIGLSAKSVGPVSRFRRIGGEPPKAVLELMGGRRELRPVRVLYRDPSYDLLVVRVEGSGDQTFTAVPLSAGAMPALLEPVVILHRLGRVGARSGAASLARVAAVIGDPLPFYVLDVAANSGLGKPVFALEGRLVGLLGLRELNGQSGEGSAVLTGASHRGLLPMVIPTSALHDALAEAQRIAASSR